jgi:hypothetical protein
MIPATLAHSRKRRIWLCASEDQACLARFTRLWDDPNAEPVDQALFADFDGDFTGNARQIDDLLDHDSAEATLVSSRPVSGHVSSLPAAANLRSAFFRINDERPESGGAQRGGFFQDFYKLCTGRFF